MSLQEQLAAAFQAGLSAQPLINNVNPTPVPTPVANTPKPVATFQATADGKIQRVKPAAAPSDARLSGRDLMEPSTIREYAKDEKTGISLHIGWSKTFTKDDRRGVTRSFDYGIGVEIIDPVTHRVTVEWNKPNTWAALAPVAESAYLAMLQNYVL